MEALDRPRSAGPAALRLGNPCRSQVCCGAPRVSRCCMARLSRCCMARLIGCKVLTCVHVRFPLPWDQASSSASRAANCASKSCERGQPLCSVVSSWHQGLDPRKHKGSSSRRSANRRTSSMRSSTAARSAIASPSGSQISALRKLPANNSSSDYGLVPGDLSS